MVSSINPVNNLVVVVDRRLATSNMPDAANGDPMFSSRVLTNAKAGMPTTSDSPARCQYLLSTMNGMPTPNSLPQQPPTLPIASAHKLNHLA